MTTPISVTMGALPAVLDRNEKAAFKAIVAGARAGARYAKGYLARKTPKDRGGAQHGWKVYDGALGGPEMLAQVFNSYPVIGVLENGARPHGVSEEGRKAIFEWVVRHFQLDRLFVAIPKTKVSIPARFNLSKTPLGESAAWRVVEGICWKLKHHGQKPLFFVRDSLPHLNDVGRREVERCLRELAEKGGKQ